MLPKYQPLILFLLLSWWIELNLGFNTGCLCQGSLLTISYSLGLQSHFIPSSLLHNLANVLAFHNWAKGCVWTAFLKFKVDTSKRDWQNVQNWQQTTFFYPKPSPTQCVVCSGSAFSVSMGEPLCLGMCPYVTDLRLHKEPSQGWCWRAAPQTAWAELLPLCLLPRLEKDAVNITFQSNLIAESLS